MDELRIVTGFCDERDAVRLAVSKCGATSMRQRIGLLSAMTLVLIGCGGGGGSNGTSAGVAPTPQRQTFAVRDTHVVVGSPNSICFSSVAPPVHCAPIVSTTLETVDGSAARHPRASQDGHIALVRGVTFPAQVSEFDVQHAVIGDIEATDPARAQFSVLGQRIEVLGMTRFEPGFTIDDLVRGRRVAVSGYFSADTIVATAIHADTSVGHLVRGIVQPHAAGGFRIGALRLDLSNALVIAFPGGAPSEGDVVLVRANTTAVNSVLAAASIRFVGDDFGWDDEDFRFFAGLVSSRPSPTELEIEGHRVDCATFRCEDLGYAEAGRFVSLYAAEGTATASVSAMGSSTYQIIGRVDALDAPGGSMTVLGFPVRVVSATLVVGAQDQSVDLSDIAIGDTVTVAASLVGAAVVAGEIRTAGTGQAIVVPWFAYTFDKTVAGDLEIRALGRTFLTNASTLVFEDCVGERDLAWLFEAHYADLIWGVRIAVPDQSSEPIAPIRIDVDTNGCGNHGDGY